MIAGCCEVEASRRHGNVYRLSPRTLGISFLSETSTWIYIYFPTETNLTFFLRNDLIFKPGGYPLMRSLLRSIHMYFLPSLKLNPHDPAA
jgi:hypothetical protein